MRCGNPASCVAVVTLSEWMDFPQDLVAVYGSMKTENLGVEKVVANTVSNPNIRYLIVCGREVRGHRSGESLKCLHEYGIDGNNRVLKAKSAIPYIENLPHDAIKRFQEQVTLIDLIGVEDTQEIIGKINWCRENNPGNFGEPLFVAPLKHEAGEVHVAADFSLHKDLQIDSYGYVRKI